MSDSKSKGGKAAPKAGGNRGAGAAVHRARSHRASIVQKPRRTMR